MKTALVTALGTVGLMLAACDNGPSAVAQQAAGTQMAVSAEAAPAARAERAEVDHRDDPVKLVDGRPMWSASRRYSAEENAQRAFARNGEAFGARNLDAFVKKAHAFVEKPRAGAETFVRANGDRLIYDPRANIFAVASSAGAPRTMFKPDEGRAYWDEVRARESQSRTAVRDRDEEA
jgi:pyocin large subunit-like protein